MSDIAKHFIEVIRHVDEAHKFRSGAYEIEKHRDCAAWLSHEAAHDLADAIEARDAELRDWQDSSEAYRKDCEAAESRAEQAERALGSARAELDVADANHRQMAKQLADLGRSLAEAGTIVSEYADEVAPTYYDEPWQQLEGPEECADADMSYWGE